MGHQMQPFCFVFAFLTSGWAVYCGSDYFFKICLYTNVIYIFFLNRKGVCMQYPINVVTTELNIMLLYPER